MKEIKLFSYKNKLEQHDFNYHYIDNGFRWWQFNQDNIKLTNQSKESKRHEFLFKSYQHKKING